MIDLYFVGGTIQVLFKPTSTLGSIPDLSAKSPDEEPGNGLDRTGAQGWPHVFISAYARCSPRGPEVWPRQQKTEQ
jgi:hypothetical protein